jgi:hypothetical protein
MCCQKSITEQNIMETERIIDSTLALKSLVNDIGLFKTARDKILIRFIQLTEQENTDLTARVTKYYKTCGCSQGRVTGILTLLVFVVMLLTDIVSISKLGIWNTILFYFLCSFITMLIGKIYGIYDARNQLIKLSEKLEQSNMY